MKIYYQSKGCTIGYFIVGLFMFISGVFIVYIVRTELLLLLSFLVFFGAMVYYSYYYGIRGLKHYIQIDGDKLICHHFKHTYEYNIEQLKEIKICEMHGGKSCVNYYDFTFDDDFSFLVEYNTWIAEHYGDRITNKYKKINWI